MCFLKFARRGGGCFSIYNVGRAAVLMGNVRQKKKIGKAQYQQTETMCDVALCPKNK